MEKLSTKETVFKVIEINTLWWFKVLLFSYTVSLLAGFIWPFELLSHFTLQYTIGGFILFFPLICFKHWKWAAAAFVIFSLCLIETRWHLDKPIQLSTSDENQAVYKIATYNHNVGKGQFDSVKTWLSENDFDAVALLEANDKTVEMGTELKEIYPYQIHAPRSNAFGMVILSRHSFIEYEKIVLKRSILTSFAIRFVIQTSNAKEPLAIYALHPPPPSDLLTQSFRDHQLHTIGKRVEEDNTANIVMVGDWNITPFSPAFGTLLQISGLHYQSDGILLTPTWPSFNFLPFLKIPIDHALYSNNLIQISKNSGPAMMSDHHPLIASFAEK